MNKVAQITITILATLALLLLLWQLRGVVAILLIAIILATTLSGFVTLLTAAGWSRQWAIATVILTTLLFIAGFTTLSLYIVGERLPSALRDFRTLYGELWRTLLAGNSTQQSIAVRLPAPALLDDLWLGTDGSRLLALVSGLSANVGAWLSNLVLVIFVALYWVVDRERIERLWLSLLPARARPQARTVVYRVEEEIGSYLRSKIMQAVLALILLMVGFLLIGLQYPFLSAWIAVILWFVPLIGGGLALLPVMLLGLIDGPVVPLAVALYTIAVFVGVRWFIDRYPALRQQPGSILELVMAIALIDSLGIVGLLIAAPVAVAIQVILDSWFRATTAPTVTPAPLDTQAFYDKVTTLHERIANDEHEISPRTRNLYARLTQLVDEAKAVDR
ncbi:MAG: AI-2E family transporter [Caldilinea sp. CFX5]|nr:AI-2E family transporter [Caldilinea sp. CFX5]